MKVLRLSPTVLRFKPLIKALKIAHGDSIVLGVSQEGRERWKMREKHFKCT